MPKTRVTRRTKQQSLTAAGEEVVKMDNYNYETPVSSSEPAPLRPLQLDTLKKTRKTLFKSPRKNVTSSYQLGVTYNIRQSGPVVSTPGSTPSSLQPLATCRKCKHINLEHGYVKRRLLAKEAKNGKGGKSIDSKKKPANSLGEQNNDRATPEQRAVKESSSNSSFFLSSNNNITQQIKETIAISPYVRNYLERKLKDKLKQQGMEGSSLWKQSIKGLKFRQSANLDELELVINLEQLTEDETDAAPKEEDKPEGDTLAPIIKCKTYTAHRLPLHELDGKEGQLRTSIDIRKAAVVSKMAGKENKAPPPESKTHQYFTRFKARTLKGTTTAKPTQPKDKQFQPNALSVFSSAFAAEKSGVAKQPKEQRFAPPKTMVTRTMVKTKVAPPVSAVPGTVQSTCPRFTRRCTILAGNELISCGSKVAGATNAGVTSTSTTRKPPIRASKVPAVTTRMTRKSSIPVFTGKTKTVFK